MILLSCILVLLRDVGNLDILALVISVEVSSHLEKIDETYIGILRAHRVLKDNTVLAKTINDGLYRVEEIRTDDVHLVDECNSRYVIRIRLSPYVLRLRLNTALRIKYADSAIKYTERTLNLYGEVYVARSIDDVDTVLRCTGDLLMLMLWDPVTCGSG